MAKKQLTKEQKKMSHAKAVSGNGSKANPYYETDYNVGKRNPKKEEKPILQTVRIISMKEWLCTLVVLCIPLLNIIALIAWANKNNGKINPSKRNFAKAALIVLAIILAIAVIALLAFFIAKAFMPTFPATPEKAQTLLQDNGYKVELYYEDDARLMALSDEATCVLYAKTDDGANDLTMVFFNDKDAAKKYYDELSESVSDDNKSDVNGKVVYYGTENAVALLNK